MEENSIQLYKIKTQLKLTSYAQLNRNNQEKNRKKLIHIRTMQQCSNGKIYSELDSCILNEALYFCNISLGEIYFFTILKIFSWQLF